MKTFSNFSTLAKTTLAAFVLLLASSGLKAQTVTITNFTTIEMIVNVYGTTTCIAGEYDCEEFIVVPAATSGGPGTGTATFINLSAYAVAADVNENNSATIGVTLLTPNCLCTQGPSTDSDTFTASTNATITAEAGCSGQDMDIEIY